MKYILLLVLIITSCSLFDYEGYYESHKTGTKIRYEVTGSGGSYDIMIANKTNGNDNYTNMKSGFMVEYTTDNKELFVYIYAQNGYSAGDVKAEVFINDKLVLSSKSSGGYCVASAGDYIYNLKD